MARPSKEPSKVIAIPIDRIEAVRTLLGRPVAPNQTPIVKIRVPISQVDSVRQCIQGNDDDTTHRPT